MGQRHRSHPRPAEEAVVWITRPLRTGLLAALVSAAGGCHTGPSPATEPAAIAPETPATPAFAADFGATVQRFMTAQIERRTFPGCQLVVLHGGTTVLDTAYGHETYDQGSPAITASTRYDLASLTKIIATTGIAMVLHGRGQLDLDRWAASLVPEFAGGDHDRVTLRHLLTHSSGLPAWKPYYRTAHSPAELLSAVVHTPLEAAPGARTTYSDLGLIMFGLCLEKIGGARLDQLARQLVFEPLHMTETSYGPLAPGIAVAATEVVAERGGLIRGRVHDENADALGGVSAHAGLFSTARDVARFGQAVLDGAPPFDRRTTSLFTRRAEVVLGSSRALGFDTPSNGSAAGNMLSATSFGHTGFTGTSLWVDPERRIVVACLTNRVHPTRANQKIGRFRRDLHDLVVRSFERTRRTAR